MRNRFIAEIPEALKPLFAYIENGKVEQDAFVHEIDEKVEKANLDEEVHGIMTLAEDTRIREIIAYDRGMAEGEQAGATQKEQEITQKLKAMGMPAEQIAEATGLTIEEIEEL